MENIHIWTVTDLFIIDEFDDYFFNKEAYKELTLDNLSEFTNGDYDNVNNRFYNNYPENLKVLAHFFKIKCDEWLKINNHIKETQFYTNENVHGIIKNCLLEIEKTLSTTLDFAKGKTFYIKVTPTIIGNVSFTLYNDRTPYKVFPSMRLFTFNGVTEFTTSRNIPIAGAQREGVATAKLSVEPFFYRDFLFSENLVEKGVVSAAPSCATITPEDFTITIRGRHIDPKYKDCWATLMMKFSLRDTDREHLLMRFNDLTNFVNLAYREESISSITNGLEFKFDSGSLRLQKPEDEDELHIEYFDDMYRMFINDSVKVDHYVFAAEGGYKDHPGKDVFTVDVYKGNTDRVHHIETTFPKIEKPFILFTQVPKL